MHNAKGCGLAAPQIRQAIRPFIVDSQTTYGDLDEAGRQGYFAWRISSQVKIRVS
jgi:peptide deformylase